ncbi:MAG: Ig-like domain-containing protein [Meiothermus sp.]|nr:Ig-like domain-containing protein [Meiothermus sp.]
MKLTPLTPYLLSALFAFVLASCGGAPQAPQAQPGVAAFSLSSNKSELTLPDVLELAVALENIGDKAVDKIEYFRGDQKIGESQGASFVWNATAESAGVAEGASATLSLSAKATLNDGSSLTSNSLNVQATASSAAFVLTLEPSGIVLQNGQSAGVKVKRSNLNGFSGDIVISLVNPPAGVSAQALTLKGADSEATLNLSASGAVVGGPLEVVVRGESDSKIATVPLALTIAAAPVAGATELAFSLDKAQITTPETVQLSSSFSNLGSKTVSKVEFFRGATLIGEDTTAPYGMSWNATEQSTGVAAGNTQSISLIAKATLNDGSVVTSGLQNLSVSVPGAPKLEQLTLQPFSLSVPQGKSASVFLTVKRTNISGQVAVGLINPPAGITLAPNTLPANQSGASLTLTVAPGVGLGTKNLTVQTSIGAVSATASLQVNVTAPVSSGSYTLSVIAGYLSVEQGKSFDVPVKINRIGGYSKDVKLFAGIIPPGVTANFNPSTLSGNETNAILTLKASHNALAETPAQFAVFAQAAGEQVQVDNFTLTISGIHGTFVSAHKFLLSKEAIPTLSTRFTDVVALPDGKFAVAAMSSTKYNGNTSYNGSVLRILPNGDDDISFGMSNYGWEIYYQNQVLGERMGVEYEVTVTGLTVAGDGMYVSGCARRRDINANFSTRQAFVNKRLVSTGAPDNNFGPDGTRFYTLYANNTISCFNGIAAGTANLFAAGYINTPSVRIGLGMISSSGTMDSSYQTTTQLNTVIPNTTASAAATTCTLGETQYVGGNATAAGKERSVVLAYRNTGLFGGFSGDGIAAFDPDQGGSAVYDLLCLPNAQTLVTAGYAKSASGKPNFAVARLNSFGVLDNSFGGDGMVTTSIGSGKDVAAAVESASNGAVIVAGHTTNPNGQRDIAIVKYNNDGSLSQGFGLGGKVIRDLGGDEVVTGMAIAPNGTIAVVGSSNNQGFIAFFKP